MDTRYAHGAFILPEDLAYLQHMMSKVQKTESIPLPNLRDRSTLSQRRDRAAPLSPTAETEQHPLTPQPGPPTPDPHLQRPKQPPPPTGEQQHPSPQPAEPATSPQPAGPAASSLLPPAETEPPLPNLQTEAASPPPTCRDRAASSPSNAACLTPPATEQNPLQRPNLLPAHPNWREPHHPLPNLRDRAASLPNWRDTAILSPQPATEQHLSPNLQPGAAPLPNRRPSSPLPQPAETEASSLPT
ncbi:ESX-1 secretion-associated protein EspI-like [Penaeus monodon]|uniref:ESX-1 secretion-associated protein EspI-like n=1 Tax=Penaeus monodon TaxID=6687 RepID=UPI0018A6E097|nr:ESX-1 secretion-associated protein EspI-like [Penaeus monodon]